VTVDSELVSSIGKGLLVFAGIGKEDTEKDAENLVNKVLKAKFWPDENGQQVSQIWLSFVRDQQLTLSQWKKNVKDIEGEVLCGMLLRLTIYLEHC
jgi:D-Tyr-tRNAtyr deacylase